MGGALPGFWLGNRWIYILVGQIDKPPNPLERGLPANQPLRCFSLTASSFFAGKRAPTVKPHFTCRSALVLGRIRTMAVSQAKQVGWDLPINQTNKKPHPALTEWGFLRQ